MTPHFSRQRGTGDKVNVENTKKISVSVSVSYKSNKLVRLRPPYGMRP